MHNDRVIFNWSGGKDSMMALHLLRSTKSFEIVNLLTNYSAITNRVSMHGVRSELIELQAERLNIPVDKLTYEASEYEEKMSAKFAEAAENGVSGVVYGDIFLEDLKNYRDRHLAKFNLKGIYPLWMQDTGRLIREFIDLGYKATVVCVNNSLLDGSFAGRLVDYEFIRDLPSGVDPCGENGEFHTFVHNGPLFSDPVDFTHGETIVKSYADPSNKAESVEFSFIDLLLKTV